MRPIHRSLPLALALAVLPPAPVAGQDAGGVAPLAEALRERIEAAGVSGWLTASGELLTSGSTLPEFYRRRGFRPAWVQGGDAAALADTMLQRVRAVRTHGLRPEDYHLWTLAALVPRLAAGWSDLAEALLVDLDLLLTDAFIELGHHLLSGRLDQVAVDPEWRVPHHHGEIAALLAEALAGAGIAAVLDGLPPPQPEYGRLRAALAALRDVAASGGWPSVPVGPPFRPGDRNERGAAVRARFAAERAWTGAPDPAPEPGPEPVEGRAIPGPTTPGSRPRWSTSSAGTGSPRTESWVPEPRPR